jgi:hypothetical protein
MTDFPTQEEFDRFLEKVTDAFRELRGLGSMTDVNWQCGIDSDDKITLILSKGATETIIVERKTNWRDWPAF